MTEQIHYCSSKAELRARLDSINKPAIANLPSGYAKTVEELWEKVIKPLLPAKEVALAWHKTLMDYVKRSDAFYVLRGYSSAKALRRGFLSSTDQGYSFVYSDNDHAFYYAKMAIDGIVATPAALAEVYKSGLFPLKFTPFSSEERTKAFLVQGKNPGMSISGYKLSHIHGLGDPYQGGVLGMSDLLSRFFNGGDADDWTEEPKNSHRYVRSVHAQNDAQKYAVAAFLRLVHPFNYFLTPSIKRQLPGSVRFFRGDVGEHQPLIDFVRAEFRMMYGAAYDEFEHAVMAEPVQRSADDTEIDLHYSEVKIVKSKPKQAAPAAEASQESIVNPYPEFKVGQIANIVLRGVLESGSVPDEEIEALKEMEASSEVFALSSYPLLSEVREGTMSVRYYAKALNIKGKTYYMCSQWTTRQLAPLLKWLAQYPEEAAEACQRVEGQPMKVQEEAVPCRQRSEGVSYPRENFEAYLLEQNLGIRTVDDYVCQAGKEIDAMIARGEPMETVEDLEQHLNHLYNDRYASGWRKYIAFVKESENP